MLSHHLEEQEKRTGGADVLESSGKRDLIDETLSFIWAGANTLLNRGGANERQAASTKQEERKNTTAGEHE